MEKAKATPKDFFLWFGAMVALYASIVAFLGLVFDYINYAFPDTSLSYYIDPYQSGISYEMAALIIIAPVVLLLMRLIRRDIQHDATRGEVWVRRWALFLVLFVAGVTIVVDLIVLLTAFLNGEELTARFLFKVLVVLLVAAAGFMHFMADLRGYWATYPTRARLVSVGVGVLVVVTVVAGFFIVGTPGAAREARIDAQRVSDLSLIQGEVLRYWQLKQKLPATLDELNDPLSYTTIPTDPTGQSYEYRAIDTKTFELCAMFNAPNTAAASFARPMQMGLEENWQHNAGRTCFTRGPIDPQLYPPFTAPQKVF